MKNKHKSLLFTYIDNKKEEAFIMEHIKTISILKGQAIDIKRFILPIKNWIKHHKIAMLISGTSIILLTIYGILLFQFIQLVKMLN